MAARPDLIDALDKRSDALHARYVFRFADKPRATRSLAQLDLILREAAVLADEVRQVATGGSEELRQKTLKRLDVYRTERDAIVEAQAAGPDFVHAALLGTRANFCIGRYQRHFAGHDRRTRDVGLLDELIEELSTIQRAMARVLSRADVAELRRDLEVVTENVGVYRNEREAILGAQRAGEPAQQASTLATLANRQFELYKLHFAGQNRVTRRLGLLERVVGELDRLGEAMRALAATGFSDQGHARNVSIVGERMQVYQRELAAIEDTHQRSTLFARIEALGREADGVLDTYEEGFAGHDRVTRDPAELSLLCDRMADIERQVTQLVERYDLGHDHGPLGLIRDALAMLEREYRAVRQARLH